MIKRDSKEFKRLLTQVDKIMSQSSSSQDFDTNSWLHDWLSNPNPALGNRKPYNVISTKEGYKQVSTIINQLQTGAYA